MGCVGSAHVSLCVGGGEAVGGWELISWSLVSVQRLDWSPCLPASSQLAPAPLRLPVAPICPRTPSRPPGSVTRVFPVLSTGSGHRGPLGRGKEASVFSLAPGGVGTGHGAPDPAQEGPSQQPSPGGLAHTYHRAKRAPRAPPPPGALARALLGLPLLGSPGAVTGSLPPGGPWLLRGHAFSSPAISPRTSPTGEPNLPTVF